MNASGDGKLNSQILFLSHSFDNLVSFHSLLHVLNLK